MSEHILILLIALLDGRFLQLFTCRCACKWITSKPANMPTQKVHIRPCELNREDSCPTSPYTLLRLIKLTLHRPHASAFALTPFTHTFMAQKDQAFPWTVRLSVKLLFGRRGLGGGEGALVFPMGPKHRAPFMAWTGRTHISLFLYSAFPKPSLVHEPGGMLQCWV